MPKIHICTMDQECLQKFQHYIKHWSLLLHKKQRNKPCFRSLVFFLSNILPILHPLNIFLIIMFCLHVHMNWSISKILIPFSKSVVLSRIACLFFVTTFDSCLSNSIALRCAFAIICTSMDCCTSFTLLWMAILLPQQRSPPLRPSTLFVLPQSPAP